MSRVIVDYLGRSLCNTSCQWLVNKKAVRVD